MFCLSFLAGFYVFPVRRMQAKRHALQDPGNTLRSRRLQALREAVKNGKNTYEFVFEVSEGERSQTCVPH
jgi:hypothetical protein